MTLPALANIDTLEDRGVVVDLTRAQAALMDVSALIRREAGKTWVDEDGDLEEVPDEVVAVLVEVIRRSVSNPTGATQVSLGDASVSYGGTGRVGALFLYPDEKRIIRRAAGRSAVGYVHAEGIGVGAVGPSDYLYDQYDGDPIPWTSEPLLP
jgi:hypothetical protein